MKAIRPFSVTLIGLGVLIIVWLNLVRFVQALRQWSFLAELPAVSPLYPALSGLAWVILGGILFWGLWQGRSWAYPLTPVFTIVYILYDWIDHFIVDRQIVLRLSGANWPFQVIAEILILAWLTWVLSRRKTRAYFGVIHEQ